MIFLICRKGTLVHSTVLVFIAGGLMGFSRLCGSPEMIIIGRFITGIHSGNAFHLSISYIKILSSFTLMPIPNLFEFLFFLWVEFFIFN